jgi:WS/DGAT/MGAT family acyltransferase
VARKPLSNVDTAWLRMEDPTNLMMITGILTFGAPVDFERLRFTLQAGLDRIRRLRQRVVRPGVPRAAFYWEDDPTFDLNYHLQRASLPAHPGAGDQVVLRELASLLASTPLDLSRPLWQFHLVAGYRGGAALICRLHHAIGDGLALVHVLLSMTDAEPSAPWPLVRPRQPKQPPPFYDAFLEGARQTAGTAATQVRALQADPSRLVDGVRLGGQATETVARLLLMSPDPPTPLKGPLGVAKRVAWSEAIELDRIKTIGRAVGATVNDVLLAALSGALHDYLAARCYVEPGLDLRAVVPVNLRRPGTEAELGNKFGLVFLSLPVGLADPDSRLKEVKKGMDALKSSIQAPVTFGILGLLGIVPAEVEDWAVNFFGARATLVATNVVGPKEKLYLAGAPIESLMFWVPQSGRLGLGASIQSYAGRVWVGFIADEGLVPDPEAIVDGFHADLARQEKAAGI